MDSGPHSAISLLACYASSFPSLGLSFLICKRMGWATWPGKALSPLAVRASLGPRSTWPVPPSLWTRFQVQMSPCARC